MHTKTAGTIGALFLAALFIASLFIDSRLTPIVGAAALLAVIAYAWAANRSSSATDERVAERETRRQKETHSGARS